MTTTIVIDDRVDQIDLSRLQRYTDSPYLNGPAGTEPYKLYAYLASQLPLHALVSDLGTFQGVSAIALASSGRHVLTMDVEDRSNLFGPSFDLPIMFIQGRCQDHIGMLERDSLILLDIDPHDGKQETEMLIQLELHSYRGILVCDDIHLSPAMEKFWDNVCHHCWRDRIEREPAYRTLDVTRYGHHSGTGIIMFRPDLLCVELK